MLIRTDPMPLLNGHDMTSQQHLAQVMDNGSQVHAEHDRRSMHPGMGQG